MVESSLVLLLKKFDKQQLKEFNNFVRSPFFNTNNALIKLYEYIRKQYPEYKPEKLEREYVFKKLYGKTKYNDGFLRVLMSNLQSLAEEYLTYTSFSEDTLTRKKFLLDRLISIGARKHAEKVLNEGLNESARLIPKGPDDYLKLHHMEFYKKYFYSIQFVVNKSNKPDDNQYNEQKFLIYHFLLRILAIHFYDLNQKHVINYESRLSFLDEITIFLEKNPEYLEEPLLNITYLRVLLLKNNDLNDYYRLKKTFYEVFDRIDSKDAFNTVSIVINYCQKNYSISEDELFLKEKFEILKFATENNLNVFDVSEGIDGGRFSTIISIALEFNEIEWAEKFIKENGSQVKEQWREFTVTFANASVSFQKKEYDEALAYLSKLPNPSVNSNKFDLKELQMRIYYEKNFIDQAESTADTFRHLIQNDKLLTERFKEAHKNFHLFYVKLTTLKLKPDSTGVNEFKEKIKSTKNIVSKKWLLEKIEQIENS